MKNFSGACSRMRVITLAAIFVVMAGAPALGQNVTVSGAATGNGAYVDLSSAFAAINGGSQTGVNISVSIAGNTSETVTAVLNAGSWSSLVVSPSGGNSVTVTGTLNGPLIELNGASNVRIDGLNSGGNALVLTNPSATTTAATVKFVNGAASNTITNATILGASTAATVGTIWFGTSTGAGNSNNVISGCVVSAAAGGNPVNGVYSAGTSTAANTSNIIQNNNICDYFAPHLATSGVLADAGTEAWNISGNRFYQTALRTYTVVQIHKAIYVNSGSGYTISANTIGYSSPAATGLTEMTGTVGIRYVAVQLSATTLAVNSVQGNTVSAISLTTAANASSANGILCGLYIAGGDANVGTTAANIIGGASGTDHLMGRTSGASGMVVGISASSTGAIDIRNNTIGGLSATSAAAGTACGLAGINVSAIASSLSIIDNIIGTATPANMKAGTNGVTTAATNVSGINLPSTPNGTIVISGNSLRNFVSYGTGTGYNRAIWTQANSGNSTTVYSITANTISDLSGNCAATAISNGQAAILGINLGTGGNNVVASNTVSNLAITNTAAVASFAAGITHANATNSTIRNNVIYNITNASSNVATPPVAAGIILRSGTTNLWLFNNMISLGAGSSNNTSFIGIQGNHGSTPSPSVYVYYNTINIQGTVTSGTLATFGIHRGDLTTTSRTVGYDIRNNLITNTRTGGTGAHYAIGNNFNNTTSAATGWSSNYNVLNADPATVGHWTTAQNLAGWRTASSSDANSFSGVAVTYVNAATDLHINMGTTPNVIESGAQTIAGYSTDIDGHTRPGPAGSVNGGGMAPDIGADEFDGVILDVVPPLISHTSPGNTCSGSDRTFTASIVDAGGVPSTGTLQPRIYFSKNAGSYFSSQGVLTGGTVNNGTWSFTISASTLSGLTAGDVVSYYFVAQDGSTPPNIGASPQTGFAATDVNNITTAPSSPHTYSVLTALSGTYTVGASGNFTTLTAAASAYNTSCLTGPVTFMLTDALYSTAETFPVIFQNNPDASATNSLLIRPAASVSAVVSGTNTSAAGVIKFLNARYITMDGINSGGAHLTLVNPNSGNSAAVWLASAGTGNNYIGVRNLSIHGGGNSTATNYGIVAGNDGTTPGTTAGADNDNITIEGVSIERVFRGIWGIGSASVSAGGLDNWNISNNLVGPASTGTNNLGGVGIFLNGALNANIIGNHVRNVSAAVTATTGGIWLLRSSGASVVQNTVNSITSSSSPTGVNSISGINIGNLTNSSTVQRNVISGIENTNTGGYGARGLILNNASTITINNNMISDISGYGDPSATYWPMGIALEGSTGNVSVDFNSIHLFGNHPGLTGATSAAGVYVNADGGSLSLRNNIIVNTYDNSSSSTDSTFALLSTEASSVFSVMDYNAYYAGGSAAFTAPGHLGSPKTNLGVIQTAFGGNVNSVIGAPVFNSSTDLHIQLIAPNVLIENEGTPVSGISVDIDLQARNGTTPDIGADEFTIPTCSMVSGGIVAPSTASACAGETLVANSTGANSGLGSTYQWRYSTFSGGPYVDVIGGSGAATTSYTSAPLPAGVYYVVMTSTCAALSSSATSNEATLTVHAVPTATAGASTASICSGNSVTLTGGTNIGSGFLWLGPNNYSSTAQSPVIASIPYGSGGTYSFSAINMACSSPVATVALIVEGTPSSITVTPTSSLVCAGDSAMFTAQGGHMPSIAQFTDQVQQNTSTTYPAPYTVYYGGQKMQFLVLASELTAEGLLAGPMTAIQFPVVSMGANWGSSLMHLENFQVSVGHTALTSVGATFQGGLTVVSPAANFTPVVGYNNMHVFSTPFVWDGVSNIIVETVFSNNIGGASADKVIQYNTPTTFQSTMLYRADNQTFSSMSAATTTNLAVPLQRPDFKLHGIGLGPFSWTPLTGLSSSSSATINAAPAAATVYTVSVTNGACASSNTAVVNVTQLPVISITAANDTICLGDGTNITASGANSYTWNTQQTVASISVQPVSTTVYSVSSVEAPCPVVTKSIEIVVNPLPQVSIAPATASVCMGSPVTFSATGASSFAWSTSSVNDTIVLLPAASGSVMVLGTSLAGCSGSASASFVVLPLPQITIQADNGLMVCSGSAVSFTALGASSFTWINGPATPVYTFIASSTTIYTVTGTGANGCVGEAMVTLNVDPCTGISNDSFASALVVYPNPSSGLVTADLPFEGEKQIVVINPTGALVASFTTSEKRVDMDLSTMAKGVYFVRITHGGNTANVKVIID